MNSKVDRTIGGWGKEVAQTAHVARGANDNPLDIEEVADRNRLTVIYKDFPEHLWGLQPSTHRICINKSLPETLIRFTFGHELSHVLAARKDCSWWQYTNQEWIADWFGHELVLPSQSLVKSTSVDWLSIKNKYNVHDITLYSQLARLGLSNVVIRVNSGEVVCGSCGHRSHLVWCECNTVRRQTNT